MRVSVLLRLFISIMKFATLLTPSSLHEQNPFFKYTTMGSMIPKEVKYNLHYKSSLYFISSFESVGLSVNEKYFKIDFQNGGHGGHIEIPMG